MLFLQSLYLSKRVKHFKLDIQQHKHFFVAGNRLKHFPFAEMTAVAFHLHRESEIVGARAVLGMMSISSVQRWRNRQRAGVDTVECPLQLMKMTLQGKVIVISEFIERHSKAKRTRAPAYSRVLKVCEMHK